MNQTKEVCEYLIKKLLPGSVNGLTVSWSDDRSSFFGIDKSELAKEVLSINFHVHFFFQHFKDKLADFTEDNPIKMKQKTKSACKKDKQDTQLQGFVVIGPAESSATAESKEPLLLGETVDCVGAAFSVLKEDEEVAQMVDHYLLNLGNDEQMKRMEQLKTYLRQNRGVQKALNKRTAKILKNGEEDKDRSGVPPRPLDYLNRLAVKSTMESYMTQTTCGADGRTSIVMEESSKIEVLPSPIVGLSIDWATKKEKPQE